MNRTGGKAGDADTTSTLEANDKELTERANALSNQISTLSSLFSMLLAIFGLILAFVTSWLMAALKDGREQVKALEQQMGLEPKLAALRTASLVLQAQAAIEEQASLSEPDGADAQLCFAVRRALRMVRESTEAHTDLEALSVLLNRANVTIENGWPHASRLLQEVLRRDVAPLPKELLQRAATLNPQLSNAKGDLALSQLKRLWCLLDRGPG